MWRDAVIAKVGPQVVVVGPGCSSVPARPQTQSLRVPAEQSGQNILLIVTDRACHKSQCVCSSYCWIDVTEGFHGFEGGRKLQTFSFWVVSFGK